VVPRDFTRRDLALFIIGTAFVIGCLAVAWKFGVEEYIDPYLPGEHAVDSVAERWEFVIVTVLSSLVATWIPARVVYGLVVLNTHARRVAESIFESAPQPMLLIDSGLTVLGANQMWGTLTGLRAIDVIGRPFTDLPGGLCGEALANSLKAEVAASGAWSGEVRGERPDGEQIIVWVTATNLRTESGGCPDIVMVFTDITWRKQREELALREARHDPLTGIPNRRFFDERLQQITSAARLSAETLAVLFIDLDGFKPVNDRHGHESGDGVLVEAARRISLCARSGDICARLGGDEFVIIMREVTAVTDTHVVARRCIDSVSAPMNVGGIDVRIGASVGVALSHRGRETADVLLKNADKAMYEAKRAGRGTFFVFAEAPAGA
jgi:diguanylate cyclase (GGDEF)-like protein/PAS domain S-box-containing protein